MENGKILLEKYYKEFIKLLEEEDRYNCVKYTQQLLNEKKVNIPDLYEKIIAPSLRNITCKVKEKNICIWQEHVRSAIVKTVIENCYTYVIEEAKLSLNKNKGKVIVLCPPEEYHDIGARMISDFFTILGYESTFVGSNTPKSDFLRAIEYIKPNYIVISITNYYNLVAAKKTIDSIKLKYRDEFKIIVGGVAFKSNKEVYKKIGADKLIDTFKDIQSMGGV